MATYRNCNLCGVELRSFTTHHVPDEHFFCRECYASVVFPFINLAVSNLVEAINGNKDTQSDFAESFEPGSESRVVIAIARIGEFAADVEGVQLVSPKLTGGMEDKVEGGAKVESEGGKPEGEGQETGEKGRRFVTDADSAYTD